MRDIFPGYDVLTKRDTPSWNEQTRAVVDRRLEITQDKHTFFDEQEWRTLCAVSARVVTQPTDRKNPVPVAALLDHRMHENDQDGYRDARLPNMREAWRCGLAALNAEAQHRSGTQFWELPEADQDELLRSAERGELNDPAWRGMPSDTFFQKRVLSDVVRAYYSHPTSWNEIGWGGPASPRGYVRLDFNRRDEWEAAEAQPGRQEEARRENRRVGR